MRQRTGNLRLPQTNGHTHRTWNEGNHSLLQSIIRPAGVPSPFELSSRREARMAPTCIMRCRPEPKWFQRIVPERGRWMDGPSTTRVGAIISKTETFGGEMQRGITSSLPAANQSWMPIYSRGWGWRGNGWWRRMRCFLYNSCFRFTIHSIPASKTILVSTTTRTSQFTPMCTRVASQNMDCGSMSFATQTPKIMSTGMASSPATTIKTWPTVGMSQRRTDLIPWSWRPWVSLGGYRLSEIQNCATLFMSWRRIRKGTIRLRSTARCGMWCVTIWTHWLRRAAQT